MGMIRMFGWSEKWASWLAGWLAAIATGYVSQPVEWCGKKRETYKMMVVAQPLAETVK